MKTNVELQRDVLAELNWEPSIDASQIGVTTREGVVTLAGHVATHTQKYSAEAVAKRVHGVKAIANEIEVRPEDTYRRDDEHIAAAALHALEWDGRVSADRVTVSVRDGWITLDGTVDHRFEKEAAERLVGHLMGARGVTNNILVAPIPTVTATKSANEIKAAIENAIRRSAIVDSRQISVEVDRDTVILTGDVHSGNEHDECERIAWTAREVSHVENCITVTPWGCGPTDEWGY